MTINRSIQIANILRKVGNKSCLAKAEMLEKESPPMSFLALRSLDLNASNVISIASCLKQEKEDPNHLLKSISFSYNLLLGDDGAIALTEHLPDTICEIGLVNCGINDRGGMEVLNWIISLPNLQMICIEQNNFSETLRSEFRKFNGDNPQVLVVY